MFGVVFRAWGRTSNYLFKASSSQSIQSGFRVVALKGLVLDASVAGLGVEGLAGLFSGFRILNS